MNVRQSTSWIATLAAIILATTTIGLANATDGIITTVIGNGTAGFSGDGGQATAAALNNCNTVVMDSAGNLIVNDYYNHCIRRTAASTGVITTIAGIGGSPGFSGDGGAATAAQLQYPAAIAIDGAGNIYIADQWNCRIRKITASTGIITTVAGNGASASSGDGGAATAASFITPLGVAVDSSGNIFIVDYSAHVIRKVTVSTGIITTVAGTNNAAGFSGDGGQATAAKLSNPTGMAVDGSGNLYIADSSNQRLRKVTATSGVISTIAGNGTTGFSGDGALATAASLNNPNSVRFDASGNLYFADCFNQRIRKIVMSSGVIFTIAGNGSAGFGGDGGISTNASLNNPTGLWFDAAGNLFIGDRANNRIRKVANGSTVGPGPIIGPIAGITGNGYNGDGGPALATQLNGPDDLVMDSAGNVIVSDVSNYRVRKIIAATGSIVTIAGTGVGGFSGDGGPATAAMIQGPYHVAIDGAQNLYLADASNARVRKISAATGIITTVAGNGSTTASGDGGAATAASIGLPVGVAVDGAGNLYIVDQAHGQVRKVTASTGIISTVAGNGGAGYSGDGGPATAATFYYPRAVAIDPSGNIIIADRFNDRIRKVTVSTGIVTTIAGTGVSGLTGDGGPATSANISSPHSLWYDSSGNLFFGGGYSVVRKISTSGTISTVAGNGTFSFNSMFVPLVTAAFRDGFGLCGDAAGNLFIGDPSDAYVLKVTSGPMLTGPMAITPSPVTGKTATLTALGASKDGEPSLKYTWSTLGTPPASVTFSVNGTNSAKTSVATFSAPGLYAFQVAVKDAANVTITNQMSVLVNRTPTTLAVTPASVGVVPNGTTTFTATVKDQFAVAMTGQPVAWSVSGGGSINASTGVYAAGSTAGGPYTVTATSGALAPAHATVTIAAAPTVATAASATPNPVTAKTTALSVLGASGAGESTLTYTWATTGTPPASVSFSPNGTNAAKASTATFSKAGSYTLQVTIKDANGLTATSSVAVTVNQTFTTIAVSPSTTAVPANGTQQFTATGQDQFVLAMASQPTITWSVTGTAGTINASTGLYTAGAAATGPFTVTATGGGKSGTATITTIAAGPTVATAASAMPNPVTAKTTALSVLGASGAGESTLTYTWATTGTPPASVSFSPNGTNAAKASTATFSKAGSYTLQATIRDANGLTATSSVAVTVNQTLTTVTVAPSGTSTVATSGTLAYAATGFDQFVIAMTSQPTFAWTVTGTGGTINSSTGLFTAGASAGGPYTVTATGGGKSGTASVKIAARPYVASAPQATPNPVTGLTTQLSTLGGDAAGESTLTYTWAATGSPPAPVTFSPNGVNAAKNTTALFSKAGSYTLQVTIADAGGLTATASVSVTVVQTPVQLAVSPSSSTVHLNGTQQFTYSGIDQFGAALLPGLPLSWSVTGTCTISSSGLLTGAAAPEGPDTVTVSNGAGVSGTASVSVVNAAPTIATAASASPSTVTGKTTTLTVLGADDGGEANLIYTWVTTGTPPAPVIFWADFNAFNGTHAASTTGVTFAKAGTYTCQVTITDAYQASVTSSVTVTVSPTLTSITVTPNPMYADPSTSHPFAAVARDQFAIPLGTQPSFTWSMVGPVGSLSASGVFTSGTTQGGPSTVNAASGGISGNAQAYVQHLAPIAQCQAVYTTLNTAAAISLVAVDPNQDPMTYAIGTGPSHGTLSGTAPSLTYIPTAGYLGADSFTFTVNDGFATSPAATVSIQVQPVVATVDSTVSPLVMPAPFDANRWANDSAYKSAYLAASEPGRIWQTATGGSGVPTLISSGVTGASGACLIGVTAASAQTVGVVGAPNAPVTFAILGEGRFFYYNALGTLNAMTVLADAQGRAFVTLQVPTSGRVSILAASPFAVGRVRIVLQVQPIPSVKPPDAIPYPSNYEIPVQVINNAQVAP